METIQGKVETGLLTPLFEARLQYQPGMAAITFPEGRSGDYLGSGDGTVNGPRLRGRVRWDLYEVQGPICETNIVGVITTDDGAQLEFETRGYGVVPDPNQSNLWDMPAVVKFRTESPTYQWLNAILALWEGTFDMHTGVHSYQAYYHQR